MSERKVLNVSERKKRGKTWLGPVGGLGGWGRYSERVKLGVAVYLAGLL